MDAKPRVTASRAEQPDDLVANWARGGGAARPGIGWFTEGFDTADLKEARTLLDKLTEPAIAAEG
jgi:hypothetical protein